MPVSPIDGGWLTEVSEVESKSKLRTASPEWVDRALGLSELKLLVFSLLSSFVLSDV